MDVIRRRRGRVIIGSGVCPVMDVPRFACLSVRRQRTQINEDVERATTSVCSIPLVVSITLAGKQNSQPCP
jgi:hypothetical protein